MIKQVKFPSHPLCVHVHNGSPVELYPSSHVNSAVAPNNVPFIATP